MIDLRRVGNRNSQFSFLALLFISALSLVVGVLLGSDNYLLVGGLGAAIFGLIVFCRPTIGLYFMVLLVPIETTYLEFVGLRVKFYQIILVVTLFGMIFRLLRNKQKLDVLAIVPSMIPLVASYFIAFVVHSMYISSGISLFVLQIILFGVTVAIFGLARNRKVINRTIIVFVVAGVVEAALGIRDSVAFNSGATSSLSYYDFLAGGRPYVTFSEPDFYAAFILGVFLLILPFWVSPAFKRYRTLLGMAVFFTLTALLLTMVRGAWIGGLAALSVFIFIVRRSKESRQVFKQLGAMMRGVIISTIGLIVVFAVLLPNVLTPMAIRVSNLLSVTEDANPSGTGREMELTSLIPAILAEPFWGHGVGTYNILSPWGERVAGTTGREQAGVVGSGFILGILFDQGLIGLIAVGFFGLSLAVRLRRALKSASPIWTPYLQACVLSLVGLTVSGQINNHYYMGFYWVYIGLAWAVSEIVISEGQANMVTAYENRPVSS